MTICRTRPRRFPRLLAALTDGVDVVYGAPHREVHGLWRNIASQVTKMVLQGVLGAETARMVGPFRVFRTPCGAPSTSIAAPPSTSTCC